MRPETEAVHAGRRTDPETGAVAPSIHLSTTFERSPDYSQDDRYIYIREANPTRAEFESALARLEGAEDAAGFASGQAAASALFFSLNPGDRVVAPRVAYHGVRYLLSRVLERWGLNVQFADLHDLDEAKAAITPGTRLVWVETPSNPLLQITDIGAVSELARGAGAICACDNTFASPVLQRPLSLGADAVVHSATKWIGGHSDSCGGVIAWRSGFDLAPRIREVQSLVGGALSPFDGWLAARGVRSLPARVRASAASAELVARFLAGHPRVERAHYPGLETHPQHALAARQMAGFGGLVSFEVKGGAPAALAVAAKTRLFTRATSLGGVESLIEHRATIEGPDSPTPPGLLRASIGLEHAEDLIEDLTQALG